MDDIISRRQPSKEPRVPTHHRHRVRSCSGFLPVHMRVFLARDAQGCLITAVFIRPGSDGVGGAYPYSTRLPLGGEGGAPAGAGSRWTCFWRQATGIQPMRHIFWVSAPTSCLVVLLLITPDLPYEQIPPPASLQKENMAAAKRGNPRRLRLRSVRGRFVSQTGVDTGMKAGSCYCLHPERLN